MLLSTYKNRTFFVKLSVENFSGDVFLFLFIYFGQILASKLSEFTKLTSCFNSLYDKDHGLFFSLYLILYAVFKGALYLQLSQRIGYIPHVV